MDEDEVHHDRLVETAAKAHQHSVAINLARAILSIHSAADPTPGALAEIRSAEAACLIADKALSDWRELHAR